MSRACIHDRGLDVGLLVAPQTGSLQREDAAGAEAACGSLHTKDAIFFAFTRASGADEELMLIPGGSLPHKGTTEPDPFGETGFDASANTSPESSIDALDLNVSLASVVLSQQNTTRLDRFGETGFDVSANNSPDLSVVALELTKDLLD